MSSLPETRDLCSPSALAALVRDFDRDAVSNARRISHVVQYQPEVFYGTVVEILKKEMESRAAQYLIALLVSRNLIFRALCDPDLDREQAGALARQSLRIDPQIDTKLAHQLADVSSGPPGFISVGMAERLLEILDDISTGGRILPSILRILRSDNPYLRSKAVLMVGRNGRSLNWIKRRLEESDTRVRANAIEAMWGLDTEEARELLGWAARDSNNRVAGNALLGMYKLGDGAPLPELVKMASHESAPFRRTAAWVMGETADPRFSEILGRMIADRNSDVRKSAFTAVGRIRAAAAQIAQLSEWPVAGSAGQINPQTGQRGLWVAVVTPDAREYPRVLPAQFHLSENGQTVWSYRVIEKPLPEPMSVIFLYPRKTSTVATAWDQGALRCLNWKRSTDLWSLVPYSGAEEDPSSELELPPFIANSSQAARAFQETPSRADCTGFWTAVLRATQPGNSVVRGKRHIIVLAPDDVGEPPDENLARAVYASRSSIQVISATPNPALEDFSSRVEGRFHRVDPAAVEDRISLAYLSLLARYEIRYTPLSGGGDVKLRVHTPKGWGETLVALPR